MATKYQYDPPKRESKTHLEEIPLIRERRRMLTPKKKLLVIYCFIIMGAFMALIMSKFTAQYKFQGQPQMREIVQILEITDDKKQIQLAFPVPDHPPIPKWIASPDDLDPNLNTGDWIGARYRISNDKTTIQILETGLVAIPPSIQ